LIDAEQNKLPIAEGTKYKISNYANKYNFSLPLKFTFVEESYKKSNRQIIQFGKDIDPAINNYLSVLRFSERGNHANKCLPIFLSMFPLPDHYKTERR